MIRVLQIIDGYSFGGIVKLMLEINKNISDEFKFDFLTGLNICDNWNNLNANRKTLKGRILYNYRLFKYLKKNKYDIVHINSGAFFFTFQAVLVCKIAGIKKIVVHSHNSNKIKKPKKFLMKILSPLYRKMIDIKLTCSKEATKSLFTKDENVTVLKNGIDIEKFKFKENIRNEYRKRLGLDNKLVYGHVGRFATPKNHDFLIDLFYEIQKEQDNAVLLLVGNGELEQKIKNKVHNLNIDNKVIFLGFREDINNLLNCMDIFIFPSFYEGLPVSIIEAQTSGLPVFVSNGISDDAKINENFYKINLFDIKKWKDLILNVELKFRTDAYKNAIQAGYDIKDTCKELEKIYKELIYEMII